MVFRTVIGHGNLEKPSLFKLVGVEKEALTGLFRSPLGHEPQRFLPLFAEYFNRLHNIREFG